MKAKNGFTLIELLAIIVILGLIAAVSAPNMTKQINKKESTDQTILDQKISNASHLFAGKYFAEKIISGDCGKFPCEFTLNDLEQDGLIDLKDKCKNELNKKITIDSNGKFSYVNIKSNECYQGSGDISGVVTPADPIDTPVTPSVPGNNNFVCDYHNEDNEDKECSDEGISNKWDNFLKAEEEKFKKGVEFCLDENECFYTFNYKNSSGNYRVVYAIAKYNLLIGNKVELESSHNTVEPSLRFTDKAKVEPVSKSSKNYGHQCNDCFEKSTKTSDGSYKITNKGTTRYPNIVVDDKTFKKHYYIDDTKKEDVLGNYLTYLNSNSKKVLNIEFYYPTIGDIGIWENGSEITDDNKFKQNIFNSAYWGYNTNYSTPLLKTEGVRVNIPAQNLSNVYYYMNDYKSKLSSVSTVLSAYYFVGQKDNDITFGIRPIISIRACDIDGTCQWDDLFGCSNYQELLKENNLSSAYNNCNLK